MCDDSWDTDNGQVVCRQLGYPTSNVTIFREAYFGQGSGSIHLDDVECTGNESSLFNCSYTRYDDCYHYEDAGVRCSGK